jgi:hypothetical protein
MEMPDWEPEAIIIWSNDLGSQINQPGHCVTDEKRGLKAEIKPSPFPDEWATHPGKPVIQVTLFDYKSADVYHDSQVITLRQAQELGQWLCQRAREFDKAERRARWRQPFSWLRPSR